MTSATKTQHRHSIRIDHDGHAFKYTDPDTNHPAATLKVKRGDVIRWQSDLGNYSILFKGESPFTEVSVHGKRGEGTKDALVTGNAGSYHYAVALISKDGVALVDDPEIIVGDGD